MGVNGVVLIRSHHDGGNFHLGTTNLHGINVHRYGIPEVILRLAVVGGQLVGLIPVGPGTGGLHEHVDRARVNAFVIVPGRPDHSGVAVQCYGNPEPVVIGAV